MLSRISVGAGLIALASTASAHPEPQSSGSSNPSSTSSSPPTIHTVNVGRGNFQFEPNATVAKPGDIVTFNFYPTNHSVVRAAYGLPCIPYEETGNNLTGFYSGNFLVNDLANPPSWNLTINDTQPVFYYCTAIDSCTKQGMVGVINPNASVSIDAQYQKALQAPYMLSPGQPFPNEGEGAGSMPTPMLTANPSLLTAQPTGVATALAPGSTAGSAASPQPSSSGSHLSGGAIAGIVIAGVAFIALLAAVFWLLGHRRGFGSATAGNSGWGKNSQKDRTEAWAANSSNGPWGAASDAGRGSEMYQKSGYDQQNNQHLYAQSQYRDGMQSPTPSTGYMQPMMSPGMPSPGIPQHEHKVSEMGNTPAPNPNEPTELQGTEVTELEAPHAMKY